MGTNFTKKNKYLLNILFIFLLLTSVSSFGQTKYIVQATNNVFTPKDLTVAVGDTVEWKDTQGYHNVNASQSIYPSNPESFGNNLGYDWTFTHIFSTPGKYDYRCDAHFQYGMVGTVTVANATLSKDNLVDNFPKIFPNPAHESVFIEPRGFSSSEIQIRIFDITGKVKLTDFQSSNERIKLDISQLESGIYLVELSNENTRQMLKLVKN